MTDDRPNPDALLASIEKERATARRGKLKVFFGMCPGVGKTYAMLQAARQRHVAGDEVVVGVVETHGRKETEAMLEGMPIAPRVKIEYRGATIEEMDLDALILWHPKLVLVDELAHTNAPGSRHPKRYQDVLEMLDAGLNVFTTVNVQHVESRAEAVRQITGVAVRETVPDSILDAADELVLVDLTPEQLRARLAAGHVYLGDRAAAAADNFFREGNLTALRELALRFVAEHVDRDLREIMQTQRIAGPWKTGDRLLVGVSASPFSEKLIRYTRRLAATMEASWIAVNIETPHTLSEVEQVRLDRYLTLARRLGAEVITTAGVKIGEALLRIARLHNVTQIVIGKPQDAVWHRWCGRGSPADWLIRHSGEIDLHMVRPDPDPLPGERRPLKPVALRDYALAMAVAGVTTILGLVTFEWTGYWTVGLFYLLAVVLAAAYLRRGPTLLLGALSALCWNYLFIPPRFTFHIEHFHDFVMFGTFFVVAVVVGHLTTRLRDREQAERRGEERATALYRITRGFAASSGLAEAVKVVSHEVDVLFHASSAVLLVEGGELAVQPGATLALSEKEESVAAWAYKNRQPAGRFTDTLPTAEALHLPLLDAERSVGVLLVRPDGTLSHAQRELLEAITAQFAIFVEKERALAKNRAAEVAAHSEKLQKALFDSVSHELKTPLAVLGGALEQPQPDLGEIRQATRRLTRTVNMLLDATRLESGQLRPNLEWCDPAELVREAIALADLNGRAVHAAVPDGAPVILVDAGLMAQALSLLLSNAAHYSPAETPIEVTLTNHDDSTTFAVLDRGRGFVMGEEQRIFEKFYRGAGHAPGGLGLGLAIAKQLIEAHGGRIGAENRPGGGARVWIRLRRTEGPKLPAA